MLTGYAAHVEKEKLVPVRECILEQFNNVRNLHQLVAIVCIQAVIVTNIPRTVTNERKSCILVPGPSGLLEAPYFFNFSEQVFEAIDIQNRANLEVQTVMKSLHKSLQSSVCPEESVIRQSRVTIDDQDETTFFLLTA
jgi:hypothetical protein